MAARAVQNDRNGLRAGPPEGDARRPAGAPAETIPAPVGGGSDSGLSRVRPLAASDIPNVARIFADLLPPKHGPAQLGCATYEEFFTRLFLNEQTARPSLPSLVAEDAAGRVIGFLGVLTRRMQIADRPLLVAYSTSFIVAPEARRSLAGLALLREFFDGPQDLSLAEGSDLSRKILEGLGAKTALLYSLHWSRVVRPARHGCDLLAEDGRHLSALLGRAVAPATDAVALRSRFFAIRPDELVARPLDEAGMLAQHAACANAEPIQPAYDREQLRWRMDYAARKRPHTAPRAVGLWTPKGEPAGWYVFQIGAARSALVLHCGARPAQRVAVLAHLLRDARKAGAAIVRGRAQHSWLEALSIHRCTLRAAAPWTMAYTRDKELLRRIDAGELQLSLWDGEWWLFV